MPVNKVTVVADLNWPDHTNNMFYQSWDRELGQGPTVQHHHHHPHYKGRHFNLARRDARVAIITVGEDVFTGGEEETDKPEVLALPSSS